MNIAYYVKSCATCDYWGGGRKVEGLGNFSVVDFSARGKCYHPTRRGVEFAQNNSCDNYSTWGPLKK